MICQNTVRKSYLLSAIVSDTTAQPASVPDTKIYWYLTPPLGCLTLESEVLGSIASVSDTTDNIFPHRILAISKLRRIL